jgi:putative hydrolase of the HAD superfamily
MVTRAILFDLDDTLFDHWYSTNEALQALQGVYPRFRVWPLGEFRQRHSLLLEQYHLDVLAGRLTVDEARLKRFTRLVAEAGGECTPELAGEIAADYRRAYVGTWRTVPGALELLEALHPQAPIGIISNNVVGEQLEKIRMCGLERYLDTVVISEEAGVAKPAARIFEIALARIGCAADEAVMVGDAWATDIAGARAAGIRAVWFNRFGAAAPEPGIVAELSSYQPAGQVAALLMR